MTASDAHHVTTSTPTLSVAIISFNEERNIARCLEAVKSLAHEMIVVDSLSTDATVAIAESLGAAVFSEPWKGHVAQKNSALEKCTGDWILCLDCDEVVSPELANAIRAAMASPAFDGYRVNRKTFFLGRWIEHAWYPDWKIRLVRRDKARWTGLDPHDSLVVEGKSGKLAGDLHHFSFRDLQDCLERQVRYSRIESAAYLRDGRCATLAKLVVNPVHSFFKHYVIKRGFLDGWQGFAVSVLSGISVFFKYLLMWEKQRVGKDGER